MLVRVNPSAFVSDAGQVGAAARRIYNATNTLAGELSSCSGMAGIDPMAEEFALGSDREGGYDQSMGSMLQAGVTLSQAVAGFEAYLIGLAASYRQMELAGTEGGANEFISLTPTTIMGSCPYAGTALGDENRGTPMGDVMQWVEEFLRDNAGIIIPTADTGKVIQAANAWSSYETSLRSAQATLDSALPGTLAATFPQNGDVSRVQSKLSSLVDALAADAGSQNSGCAQYARDVEDIRTQLLTMVAQIVAEIMIDIGIGLVLSAFTFGAGALVAAGKAITTVLKWVPRLLQLVNRLKVLIMQAKRTMAVVRRAAIEAIESTVSGTIANATVQGISGNFSWNELGGTFISSGIGGAISGPFSHIGSNIASRGGRITTRAAIDGATGGVGGVAGDWVASGATGQDFNLLMSALVGTTGGATAGGVTSISAGGSGSRPNTGGEAGLPSQGGKPAPAPVAAGGSPAATNTTTSSSTPLAAASGGAASSSATSAGSGGAQTATSTVGASGGGSSTPTSSVGGSGGSSSSTGAGAATVNVDAGAAPDASSADLANTPAIADATPQVDPGSNSSPEPTQTADVPQTAEPTQAAEPAQTTPPAQTEPATHTPPAEPGPAEPARAETAPTESGPIDDGPAGTTSADPAPEAATRPSDIEVPTVAEPGAAANTQAAGATTVGTGASTAAGLGAIPDVNIELPGALPIDTPASPGTTPKSDADTTAEAAADSQSNAAESAAKPDGDNTPANTDDAVDMDDAHDVDQQPAAADEGTEPDTNANHDGVVPVVADGGEAADAATTTNDAPPRLPSTVEVEFDLNNNDPVEFRRQLADQQDGLNKLTVQEFLDNREAYLEHGRSSTGNAAQQAAREDALADKIDQLIDEGVSPLDAKTQAEAWMKDQAALHTPDQVAGGHAYEVNGVGDRRVNSSIGSQWRTRIADMHSAIEQMAANLSAAERSSTLLNVLLRVGK